MIDTHTGQLTQATGPNCEYLEIKGSGKDWYIILDYDTDKLWIIVSGRPTKVIQAISPWQFDIT